MALIGRVVVVVIALMIAMLVAGITLAAGVVMPDLSGIDSDPMERAMFFGIAFIATGLAGVAALLPAFVLVVIAEAFRFRSFLYYGVAGAVIAFLAYYGSDFTARVEYTTDIEPVQYGLQLMAAAGIVGGLVYWLIAGRNAGKWRDRDIVVSPPRS